MPLRLRPFSRLLLLTALAATLAEASNGSFGVHVRVVDRRAEPALLDAVPLPPAVQAFAGVHDGRAYAYPGGLEHAALFFEREMPARGYRLLRQTGGADARQQTWDGADGQVMVRLRRVLGAGTRIRLIAMPHRARTSLAGQTVPRHDLASP